MYFKKIFFPLLLTILFTLSSVDNSVLLSARSHYRNSKDNKEQAEKLEKASENKTEPVLIAYHGASRCILASFKFNPYSKLSMLYEGLDIINNAASKDSTDIEIRMIRLSVETNIPSFVSFKSHISKDKAYLKNNFEPKHPMADVMKGFMK